MLEPLDVAVNEAANALAFVEAIPVDPDLEEGTAAVVLELIAPRAGWLYFRMRPQEARAIGEFAWGALASGSDEQAYQFLLEFANVVAGRLLADTYPGQEVRIGLPEAVSPVAAPEGATRRAYDLDGWRLWVELLDGGP